MPSLAAPAPSAPPAPDARLDHPALRAGSLDLPLPGSGRTEERLTRLRALGRDDLVVARLAEAHTDAVAVMADLGRSDLPGSGDLWGLWAADPPTSPVRAVRAASDQAGSNEQGWILSGAKPWCSGATRCDRALVTAHAEDGYRLFAVDPHHPGVTVRPSRWAGTGMQGSDTRDLDLDEVPATEVGGPGAYLDRTGFWWGAAGVAAVWLGGADRVADALLVSARRHGADLVLASLGRVDAARHAAWCALADVARLADSGTADLATARLAAARARAVVEEAVEVTLLQTARATGPGPLATDDAHARHIADLQVYVRQSHGDRDLAVLGRLALESAEAVPADPVVPA